MWGRGLMRYLGYQGYVYYGSSLASVHWFMSMLLEPETGKCLARAPTMSTSNFQLSIIIPEFNLVDLVVTDLIEAIQSIIFCSSDP